jgi:inositol-pentakisphosphate 2-kinase
MSTSQVFEHYEQKVKPLFRLDQLVEQIKIATSPSLLASCNAILDNLESLQQRKENRLGWHLAEDEFGLLVTSMAPTPSTLQHLEFKPKWLAQSPTAPVDSIRCRTCALSAFRNKKPQPCPLRLTALNTMPPNSKSKITPPPWLAQSPESAEQAEATRAINSFFRTGKGHYILRTLKEQQLLLDPIGVIKLCEAQSNETRTAQPRPSTTEEDITRLSMAMTLRDCTILVNVSRNEEGELVIDGRLADLDPKSGDDAQRLGKWYWDESDLTAQGWYTGTSKGAQVEKVEEEEECCLWRDLSGRERKEEKSSD